MLPRADGMCPSCGERTKGARAVRTRSSREISKTRAGIEERERRQDDRARDRRKNARARTRRLSGIALVVGGVAATIASYALAAPGGTYIVFTGLVLGGLWLFIRGTGERV